MNIAGCLECRECFSIAIAAEVALRRYYQHIADLFSEHPEITEAFTHLAADEAEHALTLEIAKTSGQHPLHVHQDAIQNTMVLLEVLGQFGQQISLNPANFDKAWEFAMMLEKSEINHIYLSLTAQTFHTAEAGDQYIASILKGHVQRLFDLGKRFEKPERLMILPKSIRPVQKH